MSSDSIQFYKIETGSHLLVEDFIKCLNDEKSSFRYFENRTLEVLKNHLETLIVKNNNSFIGYGHLDKEGETTWLGIVVLNKFQGMGIGKRIMTELINNAKQLLLSSIKLSVDIENYKARALYEKIGFNLEKQTAKICYYKLYIDK